MLYAFYSDNYGKTKFLIIAESHYLPKCSKKNDYINDWYKGVELDETEKEYLNTRGSFKDFMEMLDMDNSLFLLECLFVNFLLEDKMLFLTQSKQN